MNYSSPRILSVGTSVPPNRYTQEDIISRYTVQSKAIQDIFRASHIHTRYLFLPEAGADGLPHESQEELLKKHRKGALQLGKEAIQKCLDPLGMQTSDIDMLCCISSTGFMLPGLTAMFIQHLGFRTDCHRMDLVGMGCNAGLNGLNPASSWALANPEKNCLMVCCEINSALYIFEETVGTGVVNSLFGDGCAAILIRSSQNDINSRAPQILDFASHIIPDTWEAMSYHWKENHGKFSFHLDRDVPYVLGNHADKPVHQLLKNNNLKLRDISHWIVHSGGKKVIDAIKYTVGLTAHDMRNTIEILKNYGNLGSGSFLFSFQRLCAENIIESGDYGVMMTMGPGSTIETALLRW